MGRRDESLDDERAEAAIRRVLERLGEPAAIAPPPDLVTRTARRLPRARPAIAARNAAIRGALSLGLRVLLLGGLALVAGLGIWGAVGGGAQLALLFGDGSGGLSRALLTLELLSKPLLRTAGSGGGLLILAGSVALAGVGWLWWLLLQRTPVQQREQAP